MEETKSTLQFAARAKQVQVDAKVNELLSPRERERRTNAESLERTSVDLRYLFGPVMLGRGRGTFIAHPSTAIWELSVQPRERTRHREGRGTGESITICAPFRTV